ncbi:hypothetical protein FBZ87_10917 [Nitrospirillum amazonense]|uniref:Uncharacterized protein n=2 Tax=Nitrospirillum amazonense TaxID=28077 RepID=A0A560JDY0_9PROT|nr:hypothetical protein FBZ87_10917 [Nitrospirillum amazonense]
MGAGMEVSVKVLSYLSGGVTLGYFLVGLFFLRFWVRVRDTLFLAFATAFGLLAINQAITTFADVAQGEYLWAFGLRLAAFSLIIAAIVGKNVRRRGKARS